MDTTDQQNGLRFLHFHTSDLWVVTNSELITQHEHMMDAVTNIMTSPTVIMLTNMRSQEAQTTLLTTPLNCYCISGKYKKCHMQYKQNLKSDDKYDP